MRTFDATCPICGAVNKNLFLEETDGWMECEKCLRTSKVLAFQPVKKIPVYSMEQATILFGNEKKAAANA